MYSISSLQFPKNSRKNRFRLLASIAALTALVAITPVTNISAATVPMKTQVFTKVPAPGYPEGIAVADSNTIYVGTHEDAAVVPNVPSHVFAYDKSGNLKKDYVIQGQNPTGQGIVGMALDKAGQLYIVDRHPARVIKLNPKTGKQTTYASFRDVAPCVNGEPAGNCSDESQDRPVQADDPVFAPDGTLYVTDITQGLIWRIPKGGGQAEIWYKSPDLDSVFGPNGIRFTDNGKTLLFAQTLHNITDPTQIFNGAGRIYKLAIQSDGKPGKRTLFWEGKIGEAPDGLEIGKSGKIYVAMALPGALMVLSPDGKEIVRTPATPEENAQLEVPYDTPASVAFNGCDVLISNQAFFGNTAHQVILKVNVGEEGKPLFRPSMP